MADHLPHPTDQLKLSPASLMNLKMLTTAMHGARISVTKTGSLFEIRRIGRYGEHILPCLPSRKWLEVFHETYQGYWQNNHDVISIHPQDKNQYSVYEEARQYDRLINAIIASPSMTSTRQELTNLPERTHVLSFADMPILPEKVVRRIREILPDAKSVHLHARYQASPTEGHVLTLKGMQSNHADCQGHLNTALWTQNPRNLLFSQLGYAFYLLHEMIEEVLKRGGNPIQHDFHHIFSLEENHPEN